MNIMLTDIRSLTLETPEIPVVAQAGANDFAGMLHQQSPKTGEEGNQVIEFKEFIEASIIPHGAPRIAVETSPEAVWREFLSQDSIKVTTATEALPITALQVVEIVQGEPLALSQEQAIAVPRLASSGNGLPAGGNELPLTKQIPSADLNAETVKISLAAAANPVPQQAAEVVLKQVTEVASPVAPVSEAKTAATIQAPVTAKVTIHTEVSPLKNETREFAVAQTTGVRHEAIAAGARPVPVNPKSAGDAGKSGEGVRPHQLTSLADLLNTAPVTAPKVNSARPVETALPAADGVVKPQVAIDPQIFRTPLEHRPGENSIQREIPLAEDNLRPVEVRDVVRLALPTGKPVSEVVSQEPVMQRASETPAMVTTQAVQQAVTSAPSMVQNAALNANSIVSTTPANPLPAPLETMTLSRNADTLEWGNGLSERVNWMINQKQNSAMIRLDPPALGKLDVQIRIVDDATTITIQTQHAQTRELIESASVRLRDILQDSGYQNVNVDVSQRQDQQQARSQGATNPDAEAADEFDLESDTETDQNAESDYFVGDGILDTFA